MKRLLWLAGSSVMLPLLVAACGGTDLPGEDPDSGALPDGAQPPVDSTVPPVDGSKPDTSVPDATAPDGAKLDATTPDATPSDAGDASTDGGPADAAPDAADSAVPPPPQTCGVGFPAQCLPGERCRDGDDCEGLCTGNVCAPPSYTDGKLSPSLGETAIDCGGPGAAANPAYRCENTIACLVNDDCKSLSCSPKTNTCVAGASCSSTAAQGVSGIETCGGGETPSAAHESCCATLPLPATTTRRLDKYEITAGRMRRFIASITAASGGVANIRAWVNGYVAAHPGSQLEYIATNFPGLIDSVVPASATPTAKLSLVTTMGLFVIDPINVADGCYVGNGSYGHSTYYWNDATRNTFRMPPRVHSQDALDEKPINCVNSLMYMAFCAWDGGELARMEDYREVWGSQPEALPGGPTVYHPWAAILEPGQFNWRNGFHATEGAAGFRCVAGWPGCIDDTQPIHYRYPTRNANGTNINLANDSIPLTSAPGRFQMDLTLATSANGQGWYDIAGDNLETGWVDNPPTDAPVPVNSRITDYCDTSFGTPSPGESPCTRVDSAGNPHNGVLRYSGPLPHLPLVGYSWEGHARYNEAYLAGRNATPSSWKPVTWQYGKGSARCARTY
ncbi:MAG TPA: hypothetical protein PLR99_24225 [Polyangiaceae bacterium]|nr:hypothetical protein [Polyangiaceae bacterium]